MSIERWTVRIPKVGEQVKIIAHPGLFEIVSVSATDRVAYVKSLGPNSVSLDVVDWKNLLFLPAVD